MNKSKHFGYSAILLAALPLIFFSSSVKAADTLEVTPANFVILENDLGQKKQIEIKNNGSAEITLTITECLSQKVDGVIQLMQGEITKSSIEIEQNEVKIKGGETGTVTTRARISATGGTPIPCVKIEPKTASSNDISAGTSFVIPYIIQNFKGEQKLNINVDIGNTGIVTSPEITITGSISNTGDKFFNPKGTITITKGGVKLSETEITSQILGLMLPGESKNFEVKWTNELDSFAGIGDYQIDVRISTDQSANVQVKQIIFTYVHTNVLLLASIAGIAILAISIGVVILKKK